MLEFNLVTACLFFGLGMVQGMIVLDWIREKKQNKKPVRKVQAKK